MAREGKVSVMLEYRKSKSSGEGRWSLECSYSTGKNTIVSSGGERENNST